MSQFQAILMDCDGVLVDNREFERQVTNSLVQELQHMKGITHGEAASIWLSELASTKGDYRWYDYSFHCKRLGLDSKKVQEAHRRSIATLKRNAGVTETFQLAKSLTKRLTVTTDATQWVARLKLDFIAAPSDIGAISSDLTGSSKAYVPFWIWVARELQENEQSLPLMVIDNRPENLFTAREVFPHVLLIHFDQEEHVTRLSERVAPRRHTNLPGVTRVADHTELRQVLKQASSMYPQAIG